MTDKHTPRIAKTGAGFFVDTTWGGRTLPTLREAQAFRREVIASEDELRSRYVKA